MRVLILHNAIDGNATAADLDVLVQAEAVSDALRLGGCKVDRLPVSLNLDDLREAVVSIRPAVVFNLVESLAGHDRLAPLAPAMLDALGCPYTGSPASALSVLCDKVRAKQRLRWAGLPTPDWLAQAGQGVMSRCSGHRAQEVPSSSHFAATMGRSLSPMRKEPVRCESSNPVQSADARYIIKPIHDHASCGIRADSVISAGDAHAVYAALAERELRLTRSCFAERFIDGREFSLSILAGPCGPEVLPPAEILFVDFPASEPRIVDYEAKWEPESFAYRNTPRRFDFPDSDRAILKELAELTRACWHLFALRGYARVDFRVAPNGRPWILEVNANPCLSPDAGFAAAVERGGYSFHEATARIVADTLGDRGHIPSGVHSAQALPV